MALSMRARRTAVGSFLVAAVAVAAPALAAPNKGYTVDVDGPALAGTTVTFTVTYNAPAKQQLGSSQLTLPEGFEVVSASAAAPATTAIAGRTVTFNGLEIPPGSSEDVTVQAEVPCIPTATTWTVTAKQANEYNGTGNLLQLDAAGSTLTTPVVGTCVPCPEGQSCTGSQNNGRSKVTVTGATSAQAGELTLAFGSGLQIDCAGYSEVLSDTALFNVTGDRTKIAEAVIAKRDLPAGGADALEICFGSPEPFAGSVQQGTYDWDGNGIPEPVHVGLLPDCVTATDTLCVFNRDKLRPSQDGIIQARLPEGDPGMRP